MFEALRQFFRTKAGFAVAGVLIAIGLIAAFTALRGVFGSSEAEAISADRVFIDADNGKTFKYELTVGAPIPAKSPYSKKFNGYPAEACYWTTAGTEKKDPTYVLLNTYKGSKEPTFCPDCGRLVVGHNPRPAPGVNPPPTKAEYKPTRIAR